MIIAVMTATMLQIIATIAITFARRELAAANWLRVIASRERDIASAAAAAAVRAVEKASSEFAKPFVSRAARRSDSLEFNHALTAVDLELPTIPNSPRANRVRTSASPILSSSVTRSFPQDVISLSVSNSLTYYQKGRPATQAMPGVVLSKRSLTSFEMTAPYSDVIPKSPGESQDKPAERSFPRERSKQPRTEPLPIPVRLLIRPSSRLFSDFLPIRKKPVPIIHNMETLSVIGRPNIDLSSTIRQGNHPHTAALRYDSTSLKKAHIAVLLYYK
jgi:hypothetical protein